MSGVLNAKTKTFVKQYVAKSSPSELIFSKDMVDVTSMQNEKHYGTPLHNENLTITRHVWFDPVLSPYTVDIKRPVRSNVGDIAFTVFAAHPTNDKYSLQPGKYTLVKTGFALNSGLSENCGIFGDYPNWVGTIHGLRGLERQGVLCGTSVVRPHDHREIAVSLFNFGQDTITINPMDPVAELIFSACHVPDIAVCHTSLVKCFDGVCCLN
jgi:dUTPase